MTKLIAFAVLWFASAMTAQQVGTASWYGTAFEGKLTASGEPYDMHAMTAAHATREASD